MAVKTITVTEDAYEALKGLKEERESFSGTLLRIAKRRPLGEFFGVLRDESGERLEAAIIKARNIRNKSHKDRIRNIVRDLRK